MSGQGRNPSNEGGADDWFDLLFDDDTPAAGTESPGGPRGTGDATNPARPVPSPALSAPPQGDSWDFDPTAPAQSSEGSDEFIDFGSSPHPEPAVNTPAFGQAPAGYGSPAPPLRAPSSAPRGVVGGAGGRRSTPATVMFGAPPEPVHNATRPQSFVTPATPLPMVEAPPASSPMPPRPSPSVAPATASSVVPKASSLPSPGDIRPTKNPLRGRTPLPRAPIPRSMAPRAATPITTPPPVTSPPPDPVKIDRAARGRPSDEAIELDPSDLDFEDVDESLQFDPTARAASVPVPRPSVPVSQKATPVVPLNDVVRDLETPIIPPTPAPGPPRRDSRESPVTTGMSARREMHERFELGDLSGALSLSESLLEIDPGDADARDIANTCRSRLRAIYVGRLGSLDQVPVLLVSPSELRWLALDHRAGFVLSLIDGVSTVEEIIDVSTMPQMEVLRTLYNLITQNVINLRRASMV